MMLNTRESGSLERKSETEEDSRSGQMVHSTRGTGPITRPMEREDSFMPMEMFMREPGKTIKLMVSEFTCMLMALAMKETGRKTSNMERVLKDGLMVLSTKVNTMRDRSTVEEDSSGAITLFSKVNSKTTTSKVTVPTNGMTVECTVESGKITRCTEKEFSLGPMAENTPVLIRKT